MIGRIYKITNIVNNKNYVGQTTKTIEERFKRHCGEAKWRNGSKMPIVFAIKKYGIDSFNIELLEEIQGTQKDLDNAEIKWANKLCSFVPTGYNLKAGTGPGTMADETKKKISKSNTGKVRSVEAIKRLRDSHLGQKMCESTKRKLYLANKGRPLTKEHREKISKANLGRKNSDIAKNKMRIRKLKYNYKILSPDNLIYETNNLTDFCRKFNLNPGHMQSVSCGRINHYKNWRLVSRTELRNVR